jgi:hypothetical protein
METNNDKYTLMSEINNKKVNLIEGTFDAEEAGKVLLSLTSSKINYHTLESLSTMELYGVENANSKKRIDELRNANIEIAKILRVARAQGKRLKIDAVINIYLD